MSNPNISPVYRVGQVESLIQETEGENLPREWDFRPLCGAVNYCVLRASRGEAPGPTGGLQRPQTTAKLSNRDLTQMRIAGQRMASKYITVQNARIYSCYFLWSEFEFNLYIICLRFITNVINNVTGLAETKKCPQDLTFTKNRQNKLSHVAKK